MVFFFFLKGSCNFIKILTTNPHNLQVQTDVSGETQTTL